MDLRIRIEIMFFDLASPVLIDIGPSKVPS
jgi:hypothetical protein